MSHLGAKTTSYVSGLERPVDGLPLILQILSVLWVEVGQGARNKLLFVTLRRVDLTQKRMWERVDVLNITGQTVPRRNGDSGSCGWKIFTV